MSLEKRIKGLLNVDSLRVNNISTGTSVNNLGIDSSGNVVVGTTGDTDTNTFVTGGTLSGNDLILEKNNDVDVNPIDLSGLVSGKTDLTLFNSHTGDTNNPHQTSFSNLTSTAHTHSISEVINLQTELDTKTNNTDFISHTGDTTIHFTKGDISLSEIGNSAHTHTLSEITDFNSYSGSVQTQLDGKVETTIFNSHTGDTNNPHQTSFSNLTSTAHTHTISDVTNLQTELDSKLNITDFNTYSGNVQTELNTKISGVTNLSSEGIFAQKNGLDLEFKGITSTGGTVNISSNSTSLNLEVTFPTDQDKFVSGGTYNGGTKEINFVGNSVETTFDVDLTSLVNSVTGDTFVTGQTFSNTTYVLSTTRNDGTTFNSDLSVLASDVYVLSGVYNPSTGIVTYTNSTGGTFQVTGFTTGMTDSYTTAANLNGETIEFDNNIQGSNLYNVSLSPVLSGKTDLTLFNTHTGDTNNPHQTSFSNLTATAHTHSISEVINLQTELDSKTNNTDFISHTGDTTIHFTKSSINLSDLGSSAHTHTLSEITDFNSYSGSVQTQIDGKTDLTLFNSHTGDTNNPHQTSFSNLTSTAHTHTISDVTNLQSELDTKLNISDFNVYSGNVETQIDSKTDLTLFNSHTGDTNNPHQTSFSNLSSTAHTHTLSEITDFNSYSGDVQTQIDGKLNITDFNTYSGNVQTQLDTKIENGINSGGANEVFSGKSGTDLYFRTISGGSNTTISTIDDIIRVDVSIPVGTNTYVTGGTYSSGTLTLDRNDNNSVIVTGFTTGGGGDNFYVTGFTYDDANTLTISRNGGLSDLSATINTLTGLTINGVFSASTYTGITLTSLDDVTSNIPSTPDNTYQGRLLYFDAPSNQWLTGEEYVSAGNVTIWGKKGSAGTIDKGCPVYITGFDNDIHEVELANASTGSTMPVIGFTAEDFDNAGIYPLITFGKLSGIDTTSGTTVINPSGETWEVNDVLYMAKTDGGLTKFRPTGSDTRIQRIAKVLNVGTTNGQIFIFNTARTAGLPNLTSDYLWVGNGDDLPQEVIRTDVGITTTGFTYNDNNTFTITDDNGGSYSATINQMSGLTVTGNVGIGTTTPSHKLSIIGSNGSFETRVDGSLPYTSEIYAKTTNPSGSSVVQIVNDNVSSIVMGVLGSNRDASIAYGGESDDAFMFASTAANNLHIFNNSGTGTEDSIKFYAGNTATSTPHLHIQGSGSTKGYIGIGTETPSEILEVVQGTSKFVTNLNSSNGPLINLTTTNTNSLISFAAGDGTSIMTIGTVGTGWAGSTGFGQPGDSYVYSNSSANGLNIISQPGTGTEDYIRFYAGGNPQTNISDLHIQGSGSTKGYVGIGTETPIEKLDVVGNTKISGTLNVGTLGTGTSVNNLGLDVNGNVVSGNTNTGIYGGDGTIPLNTTASVNGDLTFQGLDEDTRIILKDGNNGGEVHLFSDGSAGQSALEFYNPGGVTLTSKIQNAGGDTRYISNNRDLLFTTNTGVTTEGFFIQAGTGNMGIGTTTPSEILEVAQNTEKFRLNLDFADGPQAALSTTRTDIVSRFVASDGVVSTSMNTVGFDWTGSTVYGNPGDSSIYSNTSANGISIISAPGTGTEDYIRFYAGGNPQTSTASMHIQGDGSTIGNVGIGTETPLVELHVKGDSSILRLETTSANNSNYIEFYDPSERKGWIGYPSSTSSTDALFIRNEEHGSKIIISNTDSGGTSRTAIDIDANHNVALPFGDLDISGTLTIGALGTGTSVNNLGIDASGNVVNAGGGDIYVTGGTYSSGTLTLDRNDGNSVSVSGFTSGNANVDNFYYSISNSVDTRPIFEDTNVLFNWDETGNDLEFQMKVAPGGSGDMRSLAYLVGGSTQNTFIVSTGVNYDVYTAGVSAGNRLEVFITAENDVTYPAYHAIVYNTGESVQNTVWIQRITRI